MTEKNQAMVKGGKLAMAAEQIDEIATEAMTVFGAAESFVKELSLAQAVKSLRELLTPEVMEPIMALQNTALGFRTDRDPRMIDTKTGKPHVPYSMDVVREVFIESRLRGFHTVGNEFNIIAGNFYGAKSGFRRKVVNWPGVTDFKDTYSLPRMSADGRGAVVTASATWKKLGVADSIERELAIRVNAGMGADAIVGKAERKLLKAVHDRLSGVVTPDAEVGDLDVESRPAPAAEQAPPQPAPNPAEEAEMAKSGLAPEPAAPAAPKAPDPRDELHKLVSSNGYTFTELAHWGRETGNLPDGIASYDDLPLTICQRLLRNAKGLLRGLEMGRGIQK